MCFGNQRTLTQARANEETSCAIHLLTQRMRSKGGTEIVPDRLESWDSAERDAEAGVTIAEKISSELSVCLTQVWVKSMGWYPAPSQRSPWERTNECLLFFNCSRLAEISLE